MQGDSMKGYQTIPRTLTGDHRMPSVRSQRRHRKSIILGILLSITTTLLLYAVGSAYYYEKIVPMRAKKRLEAAVKEHAILAAKREEQCRGIDWSTACHRLSSATARRRSLKQAANVTIYNDMEDQFLHSEDPTVTYDEFCLRVYRLRLLGEFITFPYHASQLLEAGGNQTMVLFIQHGTYTKWVGQDESFCCSFHISHLAQGPFVTQSPTGVASRNS